MFARIAASASLAFLLIFSSSSAHAQDRWIKISDHQLIAKGRTNRIDMRGAEGKFKALRLKAERGDVVMNLVKVTYASGKVHNERRRINLLQGERTRPINQIRRGRFVDTIDLRYRIFAPGKTRVRIAIWGLQSKSDAGALRAGQSVAAPPSGVGGADVLFGSQIVGLAVDRDSVRVGKQLGKFKTIRLRVLENDLHLLKMTMHYANGQSHAIDYEATITKKSKTRWFATNGSRFIDRIDLLYRAKSGDQGRAVVQVFGQYADGWLGPDGEARRHNNGWMLLGAGAAGFVGFNQEVIAVGRSQGVLRRIRFVVRDRGITLRGLRVIYGNGAKEEVPLKKIKIAADSAYGPVDLSGGTWIREIQAYYRSRALSKGKGRATVEVWGQH